MLNNEKGFTLTEVMIAIMILTVAIVSATSLLTGLINSNKNNVKTLQAYYLAQEGIEAVRNIRDTNWLYNKNWLEGDEGKPWGEKLAIDSADGAGYVVELVDPENLGSGAGNVAVDSLAALNAYAPWSVKKTSGFVGDLINISDNGFMSSAVNSERTGFSRVIRVLPYDCGEDDCSDFALIESTVSWDEPGSDGNVVLEEILTNWKGGAL